MASLYANENFPKQAVDALRALGHDVLTTADAGQAGRAIPDEEVLAFAVKQSRGILTINRRDFVRLHQRSSLHAGIIVCTQDADPVGQAQRIHDAIAAAGPLAGQLLRVNRPPR